MNSGSFPLDRVPLVLYANRFRELDRRIQDETFGRYYSYGFHPGEIRLEKLTGPRGESLDFELRRMPTMPEGTYVHVLLREPVAPGATVRIGVGFRTLVPDRFGPFGRRGKRVVLEGGVWPFVPLRDREGLFRPDLGPMLGRQDVRVAASEGEVVVGGTPTNDDWARLSRTAFIAAGEDLGVLARVAPRADLGVPGLVFRGPAGHESRARSILAFASEAALRFRRDWFPRSQPVGAPIVVVEAPLRDRLILVAGDTIVVSDRLFQVFSHFEGFHVRELTRAVFELLVRRSTAIELGEGEDRRWVGEAVAWIALEEWQKGQSAISGAEVRARLGLLDFIPSIDSLLRAPKGLPSSDVYFGRLYEPRDSLRDRLERVFCPQPRGRVVAEKLRDKIGDKALALLARATLGREPVAGQGFRGKAATLAKEDLRVFFDLWLGRAPRENIAIERREAVTLPDGSDGIAVTLRRETDDPRIGRAGEPVTVDIASTTGHDRATWDGKSDRGIVLLPRRGWLYALDVDPDQRLDEDYRGDNVWPYFAKLLVNRFSFSIDLNGGNRSSIDAGFTLHPLFDYAQSILVDGFYAGDGRGGRLTYAYHFGQQIDEITFGNTVWASAVYESLGTGLLRDARLVETKGRLAAYSVGVSVESRTDSIRPTHGGHAGIAFELSDPHAGSDFTYAKFYADAVYLLTPVRPFTLVVAARTGQVYGSDPPTQQLFDLGGDAGGVRGCRTGDFVDTAVFVTRGELRTSVLEDLDVNVLGLNVVFWRRLELIGFLDSGNTASGIGAAVRGIKDWKVGAGPGVAVEVDAAGIKAVLLRFDMGWRVDSNGGRDRGVPQYYFNIGQSF